MLKPLAPLLLSFAFASAKGVSPWDHGPLPEGNAPPSEETVSAWKDGEWVPIRKSAYGYDAHGALVHAETWNVSPDFDRYQGNWSWDFAYGEDGLLAGIRERVLRDGLWRDTVHRPLHVRRVFRTAGGEEADLDQVWDRGRLIGGYKTLKRFDAAGRLASRTRLQYTGSTWITQGQATFTYDAAGRLLGETAEGSYRFVNTYDARGNLVSKELSFWESGGWRIGEWETRTYDAAGRPDSSLMQRRNPDGSGPLRLMEMHVHTYPDPAVHETVFWTREGDRLIRQRLRRERFDARGNPIERIDSSLAEAGWSEASKEVLAYDARNNPTGLSRYAREGNQWVLAYASHAEYDAGNRQVAQTQETYSQGSEVWRREFAYRYDASGNLLERTERTLFPEGEVREGVRAVYGYAPATGLSAPARSARKRVRPAGRRGPTYLFLEGASVRDLKGRAVIAR